LRTKNSGAREKPKSEPGGGAEGLEPSRIEAEALIKCRRHPLAFWGTMRNMKARFLEKIFPKTKTRRAKQPAASRTIEIIKHMFKNTVGEAPGCRCSASGRCSENKNERFWIEKIF
jgi:hypothetical protein